MQNINILRFVLTIKQKSGRLPISPFLRCPNHGRAMVGRIMESPGLWCHDDMIIPVSLVDILAGDSEELDDSEF